MIETKNTRGVPICELDLDGITAYRSRAARTNLRFEHGQYFHATALRFDLVARLALLFACRTRTVLAQVPEVVMAGVSVRPRDVHARPRRHVHLHIYGLFANVER